MHHIVSLPKALLVAQCAEKVVVVLRRLHLGLKRNRKG